MPVFSFGEHVVYDQVSSEQDSLFYRCQEFLRKYIGMAPVIIRGRGMFQYSFGLLPHRSPVTVVGKLDSENQTSSVTNTFARYLHSRFLYHLQWVSLSKWRRISTPVRRTLRRYTRGFATSSGRSMTSTRANTTTASTSRWFTNKPLAISIADPAVDAVI